MFTHEPTRFYEAALSYLSSLPIIWPFAFVFIAGTQLFLLQWNKAAASQLPFFDVDE